jgi:ABC-type dipeptide/oligopeptide/nickel transport system permease component
MIPTLLGISIVVFLSIRLIPGDPAALIAGPNATPAILSEMRSRYGLDRPIPVQYRIWLSQLIRGDMGDSIYIDASVRDEVLRCFKNSAILAGASITISTIVGIGMGVVAGVFRRGWVDRIVMVFVLFGASLPVFWIGLLFVILFSVKLGVLPPQGMHSPLGGGPADLLKHLVLPAITASLPTIAIIARLTRSCLLEVLQQPYILAAHGRGLRPLNIHLEHALPNVAPSIITVVGAQAGYLLGGTILVEVVFSWPGLGLLLMGAVLNRDYPLIQGAVLTSAAVFVGINCLVDSLYGVFDPRIRCNGNS